MTLYHGTTEHQAIGILSSQSLHSSIGEKHYLGDGIYLYPDPYQAEQWAVMKARHLAKQGQGEQVPVVLAVVVDVNEDQFMDLDLRRDQREFFRARRDYRQRLERGEYGVRYYNDGKFCDFIRDRLGVMMFVKTFVYQDPMNQDLRVLHSNDKSTDRDITRHYWTERQVCLKDASWIQSISIWEVSRNG